LELVVPNNDISVDVIASDPSSDVFLSSLDVAVDAPNNISAVTVTALGQDSEADIYGAEEAVYASGTSQQFATIGPVAVTADGMVSDAYISGGDAVTGEYVNIGPVTVTANGVNSDAYIYADSRALYAVNGSIGAVTVTALAKNSDAHIYAGDTAVDAEEDGIIGNLTVTAQGTHSDAYIAGGYDAAYVNLNIPSVTVQALGDHSDAHIYGGYNGLVASDVDLLTVTASGPSSDAYIYASNDGVSTYGVSSVAILASGNNSDAHIYGGGGAIDTDLLGSVTVTAQGIDSDAYLQGGGEYAVNVYGGDISSIAVSATNTGAHAFISGVYGSGDIGTVTLLASGQSSDADAGDVEVDGTVKQVSVVASGQTSDASLDLSGYGGATMDVGSVTVTASAANADAVASIDTYNGFLESVSVNASNGGTATLNDIGSNAGGAEFGTIATSIGSGSTVNLGLDLTYAGGTVTAVGAGTLNLTLDADSISTLSAGKMIGNVNLEALAPALTNGNMSITTGTGTNVLEGNGGLDEFNLAGTQNTIVFTNQDAIRTGAVTTVTDIVNGATFNNGTEDQIAFSATGSGKLVNGGNLGSQGLVLQAADNAFAAAPTPVHYFFGYDSVGNGYLLYNGSAHNTFAVQMVELVGVTSINSSDIIAHAA
jgi:hypothetical protein